MTDTTVVEETADRLRNLLDKDDLLDVGKGAADILGIKPTKFVRALEQLKDEGYQIWYLLLQRKDSNLQTTTKVLTKGDMRFVDVMARHRLGAAVLHDGVEEGFEALGSRPDALVQVDDEG